MINVCLMLFNFFKYQYYKFQLNHLTLILWETILVFKEIQKLTQRKILFRFLLFWILYAVGSIIWISWPSYHFTLGQIGFLSFLFIWNVHHFLLFIILLLLFLFYHLYIFGLFFPFLSDLFLQKFNFRGVFQ